MLTHHNILQNMRQARAVLHLTGQDKMLSLLPAWHAYERMLDYVAMAVGATLTYTDRRRIKEDLKKVQPTVFAAVPRIWEMLHDGIVTHGKKLDGLKGKILRKSLSAAREVGGGRGSPWTRMVHRFASRKIYPTIREVTGGNLRIAISGGGALPRHVDEGMLGVGIPIINGYGLTETSPLVALRLAADTQAGAVGPPVPDTEFKVRDLEGTELPQGKTGVLYVRGPQIMRGYYQNEEATAKVLDSEGWFNTGDLGHLDAEGRVWITGRAKDTIVLASGENVEPEPLETAIKTSAYIQQVVVVGQDRKQLGALLVVDDDSLEKAIPRSEWTVADGWIVGESVLALLRKEMSSTLTTAEGFRSFERVGPFRARCEAFSPENGLLTPTLKLKRHVVTKTFATTLAEMFGD